MPRPSHLRLLVLVLLALLLAIPTQTGLAASPWTRQFGGPGDDYANGVAVDAAGNSYVVGGVSSALPDKEALGDRDAFVRKYHRDGWRVWTDQFGSATLDEAKAVTLDRDGNVYVAGIVGGPLSGQASAGSWDAFVRKYHRDGWRVWTRQFGSPTSDFATGIAVDAEGNVYVVGVTIGALPGQTAQPCLDRPPCSDAFVRKYDPNGAELWTRQFGTPGTDAAGGVAVDVIGDAYVVGSAGGALPGKTAVGGRDAFVRKYHRDGWRVWTDQFGTADDDGATGVAVDGGGHVYVTGTLRPFSVGGDPAPGEAFLRRYTQHNGVGALGWSIAFGVNSTAAVVALDSAGDVYVAGAVRGALPGQAVVGNIDAFVRKYHLAGTEASAAWTRQFGSGEETQAMAVATRAGQATAVGFTYGALPGETALGAADAFVTRIALD